jgi:hypothetical protein
VTEVYPNVQARAEEYARAVEAELTDLPESQRSALTRDLATHLAESAETGLPLVDELGPPSEYAVELRSTLEVGPKATPASRSRAGWLFAVIALAVVAVALGALLLYRTGTSSPPSRGEAPAASPIPARPLPDLVGLPRAQAAREVNAAGLRLLQVTEVWSSTVPKGYVAGQRPLAGRAMPYGGGVVLIVSSGPRTSGGG